MDELIKIIVNEDGEQIVSSRELHEFLNVKSRFNDWIVNRIEKYNFEDEVDYTKILVQSIRGQNEYDYAITTDMAKELAMVENNEKGRAARKYFINVEKNYKKELIRIQDNAYRKIGQLQMEIEDLKDKISKPVVIAKREIDVIAMFNYINELAGDGLLFNEMYYKLDKSKGTLSINIRKTYKVLKEHYKDIKMFKSQPIAIESALEKQDFCKGTHFVMRLMNDKYDMHPTHVAIIDIKKLEDAGGCIDNL